MRRGRLLALALVVVVMLLLLKPGGWESISATPITLAMARETNHLAVLAVERGAFREEGLEVRFQTQESGKKALTTLLEGRADLALVGLGPLVLASFQDSDFQIVASVATHYDLYKIVARQDRDITAPAGLRGKRLGTTRASSLHYFASNFIQHHGMAHDGVTWRFVADIKELPLMLERGEIDAFCGREPYVGEAVSRLGEGAAVFHAPELPSNILNLITTSRLKDDELTRRLLRALLNAETYFREHRTDALAILARGLGKSPGEVERDLESVELRISLTQTLILEMEQLARWAITNRLVDKKAPPDFITRIHGDPLFQERPGAVDLPQR